MKKRLLSITLAICLCIFLIPGYSFANEETHNNHCNCGDIKCSGEGHGEYSGEWTEWKDANSLPGEVGHYYLATDVALDSTWHPVDGIYLCLNGHCIQKSVDSRMMEIAEDVTLTICD